MEIAISHFDRLSLQSATVAYSLLSATLYTLPVERLIHIGIGFGELQLFRAKFHLQERKVGLQTAAGLPTLLHHLCAALLSATGYVVERDGIVTRVLHQA